MKNKLIKTIKCQLLLTFLVASVGDYLLYGEYIGCNLAIFQMGLLLIASTRLNGKNLNRSNLLNLFLASCLILSNLYEPSLLATTLFFIQVIYLFQKIQFPKETTKLFFKDFYIVFLKRMIFELPRNLRVVNKRDINKHKKSAISLNSRLRSWTIPIGMSLLFLCLFSMANPLIEKYFLAFPIEIIENISFLRIFFFMILTSLCWAFLRTKVKNLKPKVLDSKLAPNCNDSIVYRCLFMFNLVFSFENITDLIFLFSGNKLPDGITYAEYAHRGVYPLIITILLAGVFVLIVFNQRKEKSNNKNIYILLYLWIFQNIFLIFSSTVRMIRYIDEYALTEPRLYTLIWLALVATGITLMTIRIIKDYSNDWLIDQTSKALYLIMFTCCFVNIESNIVLYNIKHSNVVNLSEKHFDQSLARKYKYNLIPAYDLACKFATSQIKRTYYCELLNDQIAENNTFIIEKSWKSATLIRLYFNKTFKPVNTDHRALTDMLGLSKFNGANDCVIPSSESISEFYRIGRYEDQISFAKKHDNSLYFYALIYLNGNAESHYDFIERGRSEYQAIDRKTDILNHIKNNLAPEHPVYRVLSLGNSDSEYALGLGLRYHIIKNNECIEILCRSETCRVVTNKEGWYW